MKRPETAYQRYFEIVDNRFVDQGGALIVGPEQTEKPLTTAKRLALIASGIVTGALISIPPLAYVTSEVTQRLTDPSDNLKVGAVVTVAMLTELGALMGGGCIAEGIWDRYFKSPRGIVLAS